MSDSNASTRPESETPEVTSAPESPENLDTTESVSAAEEGAAPTSSTESDEGAEAPDAGAATTESGDAETLTGDDGTGSDGEGSDGEDPAGESGVPEPARAEDPPGSEAPSADAPAADAPAADAPAADAPATDVPATDAAEASVEASVEPESAADDAVEQAPAAEAAVEKSETPVAGESPAVAEEAVAAAGADEAVGEGEAAPEAEQPSADGESAAPVELPSAETPITDVSEVAAEVLQDLHADDPEMIVLKTAMADMEPVEGRIIGWNKGGYHVALGRMAAFCPVSQIEVGKPKNPKRYVDRTFKFHVSEIAPDGKRIVVSRSSALKQERKQRAERIKERLQPGTRHKGRVTSLTDFGAFVNVGDGAEGLVHVSEISRSRVDKPADALQAGQEVEVEVLKIEKGGQRISLSMKRCEPDPWKGIGDRYSRGQKFKGKVVRKAEFGVFVEIEPGLEGLVHVSRLPLGKGLEDEALAEGAELEGWVQEVEGRRRRISLSLREVSDTDPWKDVETDFPPGSVVEGKVEKVARFGVFVELKPGLTGLLPFSVVNLPAEANPRKKFPAGSPVRVTILDIEKKRQRISLGTEGSQAEGTPADFRQYKQEQEQGGFGSLAAALKGMKSD